jgi:hypothetical protein
MYRTFRLMCVEIHFVNFNLLMRAEYGARHELNSTTPHKSSIKLPLQKEN